MNSSTKGINRQIYVPQDKKAKTVNEHFIQSKLLFAKGMHRALILYLLTAERRRKSPARRAGCYHCPDFSYITCMNLTDCEFKHIFGSWALSKKTNNHRLHTNLGSIYGHCVYSVSNVTDWLDISCNILITICTVLKIKPTVYFHL